MSGNPNPVIRLITVEFEDGCRELRRETGEDRRLLAAAEHAVERLVSGHADWTPDGIVDRYPRSVDVE